MTRARVVAPFALAALSTAAALSLSRVFETGRFVVPVLVGLVLAHLVGAACRWRNLPLWATAGLELLTLGVFVGLAFGPRRSIAWFEIGGSDHSIAHQLQAGWDQLRTAPPPAPVTDGARLLAVLTTFTVAAIADWLAFRRNTVLAATAPALVLFVWASTLGSGDQRTATVIGFAAAAATFVLAQNLAVLDRGRSWLVSRPAAPRHWLAPAVLLAIAALAAGVLIAPVVPGAGSEPILDFADSGRDRSGGRSYRTGIAPLVDVSAKLNDVTDTELFAVAASQPEYWRVAALDQFTSENGGQWTLSAEGGAAVRVGFDEPAPAGALHQEFDIGPMGERWLPAAYRAVATDLDDTLVVTASSTLVAAADRVENLRYSVESVLPPSEVTPAMQQATAAPPPARLARYTEVPDGMPLVIADTARRVVDDAGATNGYTEALALRDFFRSGAFTYDISVDPVDTPDAIAAFLEQRRGFCVQFASAYAVMARTLGMPARVAVGFTPGDLGSDGVFRVSAHDAHAWPEVWLTGVGWTNLFDPTPPSDSVDRGGSDNPSEPTPPPAVPGDVTATTAPTPATTLVPGGGTGAPGDSTPPVTTPAAQPQVSTNAPDTGTSPWLVVVAVLLVGIAVASAYVVFVLVAKDRRRRHRRDSEPRAAVLGAWEQTLDELRQARVTTDPALTPLELSRVIPGRGAPHATRPLRDIARTYTAVRYGNLTTTADDASRVWDSVDALTGALAADLTWRERWRRRLDPSTLRAPARR